MPNALKLFLIAATATIVAGCKKSDEADQNIVITNTIPLNETAQGTTKIRQLSVAFLFAETIRRISDGESVTSLFSEQNNNF